MGMRPNQRIALTKELIHRALIDLLKKQDIHRISIRELCDVAGINRTTFYNHYGNQYDVLLEMENELLCDVAAFLSEDNEDNLRPLEQILQYLEGNIHFVRLLFNSNVDPEFPRKLFSLPPILRMLQGISRMELSEPAQEYAMNFLLYGGFQIVQMWVNKEENRESPEEMAALIEALICKTR